ncbi:hypothetical protein [Polaribacter sp.]|uniref:hypothetical protein n=1 Tax=Polaribacter sp. TaxID=1920175 RepID=UPI003F6B4567
MIKKLLLFLVSLACFSCASVFNKETTVVNISADKDSKIVYQQDTLQVHQKEIKITPTRRNRVLKIKVLKDSLQRDFYLEPKLSILYWANILNNYGVGMLIDLTNNKRFTYAHHLHFITDSVTNQIVLGTKKVTAIPKHTFFVYTSPLQFLDFFNEPMGTLGAEYFYMKNISVSGEYGFRNSSFYNRDYNFGFIDEKASVFRIETKWYNAINLTKNVHLNEYLSLEYRQLNSSYHDNLTYYFKDYTIQSGSISDDFATQKTVSIVNLKYGILVPLGKKLYFDFYTGFGIRTKQFNHINLEYNQQLHNINFFDTLFLFNPRRFKNYDQRTFLNYSLGFKFGIKL